MTFRVILLDPPWTFNVRSAKGENRSASNHYPCLDQKTLLALGPHVAAVAHKDAVMFLWATNSQLVEALAFMDACDFEYKSLVTWVKMIKDNSRPAIGTGYRFRGVTEQLLLGVRKGGKSWSPSPSQRKRGIIMEPRREHSRKPNGQWDFIEIYPGPKLEIFARQEREGWISLGNEIDGQDIRDSLPKLSILKKPRRSQVKVQYDNRDCTNTGRDLDSPDIRQIK